MSGDAAAPSPGEEALVTIACIQMEPRVGERERNVRRSLELLDEAAARGAKLIVLPELCNSGYMFRSRAEAFDLAEEVPGGPTVRAWAEIARARGVYVVAAFHFCR